MLCFPHLSKDANRLSLGKPLSSWSSQTVLNCSYTCREFSQRNFDEASFEGAHTELTQKVRSPALSVLDGKPQFLSEKIGKCDFGYVYNNKILNSICCRRMEAKYSSGQKFS